MYKLSQMRDVSRIVLNWNKVLISIFENSYSLYIGISKCFFANHLKKTDPYVKQLIDFKIFSILSNTNVKALDQVLEHCSARAIYIIIFNKT